MLINVCRIYGAFLYYSACTYMALHGNSNFSACEGVYCYIVYVCMYVEPQGTMHMASVDLRVSLAAALVPSL